MQMQRAKTTVYYEEIPNTLNGFRDWEFSSGGTTGEDFIVFSKKFKQYIKANLPEGATLANFSAGHYYISGFIERAEKFVYFSIPDVRFSNDGWINNILIRSATGIKDYTGGRNDYTTLNKFKAGIGKYL